MNSNPICHPSPANKMKCSFLDYIQFLMISWACRWTWTPSITCLQQKNEMLIFWLCSTSDDWPGWSMDSNPIHHPSPANKMKCFFLDYVHFWWSARLVDGLKPHLPPLSSQRNEMLLFGLCSLLMISQAGWWTQTPSATSLQPKKWNAHFWITFTLDDQPGWSMDSNPIHHPSPAKKNEMLIFGLCSTSDDQLDWSMDSNHICHPSPTKKMKCSFFKYIQLLMIS